MKLLGTGRYLPEKIVSNDDLSRFLDTSDEWIFSRTGIRKRRIAGEESTAEMACRAGERALEAALIDPEQIDLIIVATMSGDGNMPGTACMVQRYLKASKAVAFDLNAACSGFVFAMNTAKAYMEAGMVNTALVIGADMVSRHLDWEDRSTCVLFGDGAGAAVFRQSPGVYASQMGSDGNGAEALTCKAQRTENPFSAVQQDSEFIRMDGQRVFRFAVTQVPQCVQRVAEKAGMQLADIKYLLLHQANERIIRSAAKRLRLPIDKFPMNVSEYGNTSAASIPILLDELKRSGEVHNGDLLVFCGFGAGLSWGAVLMRI